jgi:hypothetical protein
MYPRIWCGVGILNNRNLRNRKDLRISRLKISKNQSLRCPGVWGAPQVSSPPVVSHDLKGRGAATAPNSRTFSHFI